MIDRFARRARWGAHAEGDFGRAPLQQRGSIQGQATAEAVQRAASGMPQNTGPAAPAHRRPPQPDQIGPCRLQLQEVSRLWKSTCRWIVLALPHISE